MPKNIGLEAERRRREQEAARAQIQAAKGTMSAGKGGLSAVQVAALQRQGQVNSARQLYEQYQRELTDRMRSGSSMRRGGGEDMYNRWRTETYAKARAGTATADEVAALREAMGREEKNNINFGADLDENRARYYSGFDADAAQKQLDKLMEGKRAYEKATRGNDAQLRTAQIGQMDSQIAALQREIDNAKTVGAEVRKQERIAERERNRADLSNVNWDTISTADIVKLGLDNVDLSTVDAEAMKRRMDREKRDNNLKIAGMEELYNQARQYAYESKGDKALGELDPQTAQYIETLVNRRGVDRNTDYFNGTLEQSTNNTPFDVDPAQFEESPEVQEARAGLKAAGYTDEEISQLIDYRQRQVNKENYMRALDNATKMAQESPVGASALSVATNLGSGFGMLDAAFQRMRNPDRPLDYYSGNMVPSAYTSAIREQVGSDIAENHGQLGNFLYQTGMSMADSAVNTALAVTGVPEWFGLSIMGGSAATSAMREARDRGVSDTQAMVTGLAAGVAESLFERVSLENVLHTKAIDADKLSGRIMQLLRNLGTQGFTEGSEEFFTTIANTITDKVINGNNSEFDTNVRRYMQDEGMSAAEARKRATGEWIGSLAQDFAGGFLSGGVMGGAGTVGGNIRANSQFAQAYTGDTLQKAIDESLQNDSKNRYALKAQKQVKNEETVSGHTIRRMLEGNENAVNAADVNKVRGAVENRLVELGETAETAKKLAPVIAKKWAGDNVNRSRTARELPETDRFRLSVEERDTLRGSRYADRIMNELNDTTGETTSGWLADLETKNVKTGTQMVKEFNQLRERVQRAAIDKMDENVLTAEDTGELEQQFGKAGAYAFTNLKPSNMDDGIYYHAFNTAYLYGSTGATLQQAKDAVAGRLDNSIVEAAFAAGEGQAQFRAEQAVSNIRTQISGTRRGPGRVVERVNTAGLTDVQRNGIYTIRRLAQLTGINFEVFESGTDADGNFVGENGSYDPNTNTIRVDINAGRTGIADTLTPVMMKTMGHELTHFIQHNAGDAYQELKQFVTQHLISKGQNLEDLARRKIRAAEQSGDTLTPDGAIDEVVADACENMLRDTTAIDTLAKENWGLFKRIRNWLRNFHNALKRAFAGDGYTHEEARLMLDKAAELQKIWDDAFVRAVQNYQQTMDGRDAVEMVSNGQTVGVGDENGHTQLSMRTYDEGGREQLKKFLDSQVKKNAITREEANDMLAQMEEMYNVCKEFADQYGLFGQWSRAEVRTDPQTGKPIFSVVKANGEYAMNLDFSLVCKKRRTLDAVFEQMINDGIMEDFDMVESSIAAINDIIRDHGFETACALCFVDAKRYRQGIVADAFVSMYNDLVRSMIQDGQHADSFNFGGNSLIVNDGHGIDTLKNSELDFSRINEVLKTEGSKTVLYKIAKDLKENPADRKLLMRGDFMSAKAFDTIKETNQRIMGLYNAKKGAGGPKASSLDVQYLSEILAPRKFNVNKAYSVGGVRIQSFSDYMPRLVFDYVQMIGDLSAKQLPAHAYTKEALFALQFGMTGVKTNMSLVPEVIDGGIAPGLDADGNYAWRDGQSFGSTVYGGSEAFIRKCYEIIGKKYSGQDRLTAAEGFELAKAIQSADGYHRNCGTIAVGVSDQHIRKMLRDPDIRMVIPYHKSSLNHIVAVMTNIDRYTDYTGVQNTRKADGTKLDAKQKDFNYNEALRRLGDAKAAADEYLAWCDKRGYLPKFDQFRNEEGYYKLLEDFTTYDMNGEAAPQGGVTLTLPGADSAFGSMQDLIRMGLEEDALLQGKQDTAVPEIVKQIKNTLPTFEAEQRVQKSERDVKKAFLDGTINVNSTEEERYEALKNATITPATFDMDKLDGVSLDVFNTRSKSAVEEGMKKLAAKLGVTGVDINASQLDFPFRFSNKNLGKSLHHQLQYGGTYQDYAKALTCFNEIVENAVPVETHKEKKTGTSKENPDLKQVYVMLSAFRDGNDIVPVEMEIKAFWLNPAGLYLNVMLTKIDSGVLETPAAAKSGGTAPLFPKPTYTLRSLLANVNPKDGRFLKYAPDGFLDGEQISAKENALQKQSEEYKQYDIQNSLRAVEPVQSSGGWQRTIDTQESMRRFPGLWNVTAEESEVRNPTQIKSTVNTYRKIYDLLQAEGFDGTILDASSGLGYGTQAGREEYGFDVDDIEPYPDASYKPRYTDYSKLNKTYDAIISNAVLNVLPQDQRDALVVKMGEMLNPGGKMYINVRGKDVDTLASGKDNVNISPMEWYVASTGSYQKGFTKSELKAYLEDALGSGYTVQTTSKFGGVAVIVTKDAVPRQYSLRTPTDIGDREILAGLTAEAAQNPAEQDALRAYQKKAASLVQAQQKLAEQRALLRSDSVKGDERLKAQNRASVYAGQVDRISGELTSLGATKTVQGILNRERVTVRQLLKEATEQGVLAGEMRQGARGAAEIRRVRERYEERINTLTEQQRDLRRQMRDVRDSATLAGQMAQGAKDAAQLRATRERMQSQIDELTERIDSLKTEMKQAVENATLAGQMAQGARDAELMRRYNERMQSRIRAARQSLADYRERRWDTEDRRKLRERIGRSVKQLDTMLRNPTDQKHIPDGLQGAVLDLLDVFTNDTSVFDRNKLARVTAEYQRLREADSNLAGQYDEDIPDLLNDLAETIDGRRLSELSAAELRIVKNIVDHFKFMVKNENAIFVNGRRESLVDMAESVIAQSESKGYKVTADFGNADSLVRLLTTGNIKPEYFFRDIGGRLQTLWNALKDGQNKYAFHLQAAKSAKEAIQEETGYKEWWNDKTVYTATTEAGQDITLNLGQALSLIATYQRELATGNTNHVTMGGFLYAEDVKTRAGVKDITRGRVPGVNYRTENRDAHPMSVSDMEALTEWLRSVDSRTLDYVARMVQYLSEDMAELGNETSLELYGYRKFGEEYYYPIRSAEEFLKTEPGRSGYDNSRIKNMGFSKATIRGANNPFVLMDFDEVWGQHVSQMCLYNGMAGAQDNIVRLLNYKHRVSEDGPSTSVKSAFKSGYGDKALQYIDTLLADLNGGVMIDPREGALNSMISLFKKNAVFASLSVAIQQPSSIARAMAVMDPKYLIKTLHSKRDFEELKHYSGVAIIKEIGGFDTNTGRSGADWLMTGRKRTVKETYETAATWLPQKMDEITWGHIWNAVKAEISATTDLEGEAFYERCGRRFDEIVELTQVYDSVLTRSENMRSKSGLVKAATSFMAEPTTTLNMMMYAFRNAKSNPKQLARTMGAVVASILLNNLLKAIVTAPRDKDEDRTWLEKYVKKMVEGTVDDLKPWGYVPLVKDVQDIIKGYTVEASYASVVSDLVKAVQKSIEDPSVDSGIDALAAVSGMFGVPTKNLVRDIRSVVTTFVDMRPLDETSKRGLQKAFDEALGLKTKLKDDVGNLYKADQRGNTKDRQKYLDEIALEYEDKVKHFLNDGYSRDEAAKKARSSVMSTVTSYLKPLYQAAQTAAEKNRIRSLALRIYFGGKQLYGSYDFERNWG